ncbi:serine/threonine-protein kinase [Streptomyces sp. NBC_01481]|uniref:serine/threonine protein kinase n=1 Tax=Streptomyces sp. NBC_01481 TaxID=2975869 RepID=UPI00224E5707|nr:serine/threonine-protein kinase [Streptomyces sp. NBC_01481]MCX4582469.1 serine/threonine protein kinase [Streptomyces sp. NBC_01481]
MPALQGDPERIASYRVLGRLGSGGMGTVYAATDPAGHRVAVKVIHAQHAANSEFRARFHREVEVLRRVGGTCLVPLLDAAPGADVPWLATEYVPGPTLQQHLAAGEPLSGIQLHLFAAGTAGALAAIHAAGVVHRDLKPTNVILAPQGPRVLDFGIAHVVDGTAITRTGIMSGTPGWISPEHYRDGADGTPGDVFAWGALIAYAATGRLPFGSGAPDVVAFRVMREQPDLNCVPDDLRGLVEACLAKEPGKRPTAETLAEKTADLLGRQATQLLGDILGQPTMVDDVILEQWRIPAFEVDPAWAPLTSRSRHKRTAWLAGVAIAVLATAIGTWNAGILETAGTSTETASSRDSQTSPLSPTEMNRSAVPPQSSPTPTVRALSSPSSVPSPSPTLSRTRINTIAPWAVGGYPAEDITVTGETIGSCWSSSEATMRLDAWRCSAESEILDPCFAPDVGPEHQVLLCMGTGPTRMVRLTLTETLPGNNFHIPGGPEISPIIIVLADGDTCRVMTGATTVLAEVRMNYSCENGGHLYGDPDKTDALWVISHRANGAGTSVSTPIASVYQ